MTVPLYSYDLAFLGDVPERFVLRLERDGLAKVIRQRTGDIARAIRYRRPGDPAATTLRDYHGARLFLQALSRRRPPSLGVEAVGGP